MLNIVVYIRTETCCSSSVDKENKINDIPPPVPAHHIQVKDVFLGRQDPAEKRLRMK